MLWPEHCDTRPSRILDRVSLASKAGGDGKAAGTASDDEGIGKVVRAGNRDSRLDVVVFEAASQSDVGLGGIEPTIGHQCQKQCSGTDDQHLAQGSVTLSNVDISFMSA